MRYLALFILIFLSSCTDDKSKIYALLDARNTSISQQNITSYTSLLDPDYFKTSGENKVMQMKDVFTRFDVVKMNSRNREIRMVDKTHAICEQTYILKVFADKEWREIVQREQLTFKYADGAWRISGGL